MDWPEWEPWYRAIRQDFGYSEPEDEAAARVLAGLLAGKRLARDDDLRAMFQGREVVVAGPALRAALPRGEALIACDSATEAVLARGATPDLVVTDLDGAQEAQVEASRAGAVVAVHAHGDNGPALRAWVPRLEGPVLGTCQSRAVAPLVNAGGFTDGDRACFLAAHYGARALVLAGFDFEAPVPKAGRDPAVKARKLAWARRLLGALDIPVKGL